MRNIVLMCFVFHGFTTIVPKPQPDIIQYVHFNQTIHSGNIDYAKIFHDGLTEEPTDIDAPPVLNKPFAFIHYVIPHFEANPHIVLPDYRPHRPIPTTERRTESPITTDNKKWIKVSFNGTKLKAFTTKLAVIPPTKTTPVAITTPHILNLYKNKDNYAKVDMASYRRHKEMNSRFNWKKSMSGKTTTEKYNSLRRVVTLKTDYLNSRSFSGIGTMVTTEEHPFWPGIPDWWWKTYFDRRDASALKNRRHY